MSATLVLPARALSSGSCQVGRFVAADRFTKCRHHAFKVVGNFDAYQGKLAKCLATYQLAWPKLQTVASAPCNGPSRFVDNGDGIVTDTLTGLQWEQTTDDGTVRDKDDEYTWSASGTAADGTAYTTFLATLNQSGACFAGQCDWRLPTSAELQSIESASFPNCNGGVCIDGTVFGPVSGVPLWTSVTATDPTHAWYTTAPGVEFADTAKTVNLAVRAVRGGL